MKRILVADDHAVVRRGLIEMLAEQPDIDGTVGEVESYPALFEALETADWDVIILDIKMPGGQALEALARIERLAPDTPVLVLSGHAEDQFAVRMIRAGAAGYLTKESAPDRLVEAVRTVLAGRRYLSPALGGTLAATLAGDAGRPLHETLSDREFQTLCMIAAGRTTSEIADELFLSVKTVSTYRRRVLDKLEMSTNADLTRYAMQHGLV